MGPIDPQFNGVPCKEVLAEFDFAKRDIAINPHSAPLWQAIIGKYHPTLLGTCQHAIAWSESMVIDWLSVNMCKDNSDLIKKIVQMFSDHNQQKSHARHISKTQCEQVGLKIISLEDSQELQDAVLTTHHAFMHTFSNSLAVKIIENHNGVAYIEAQNPSQK